MRRLAWWTRSWTHLKLACSGRTHHPARTLPFVWILFFLKGLTVNPTEFSQTGVPQEWSTVVLLALYYGNELNEVTTTTNKSIWYSVHNKIAFAIVCNSVRGAAQNNFQKLQLRASKSKLMFGQKKQKGILPVQPVETETMQFEPHRRGETMAKFLQMPEKVRTIFVINRCSHCTLS